MKQWMLSSLGLGKGKSYDRHSLLMIIISISLFGLIIIYEFLLKRPGFDLFNAVIGSLLLITGWALRVIAHNNLGKQFRIAVKIVKDHQLINTGIHKHIRHPMYTGMFLLLLGIALIFSSLYGILFLIFIITPIGIYRTAVEEKALKRHFGRKYSIYCKKTKRFVPYIF